MANMYFSDALRHGPLDPTILLYQAEIQVVKNRILEARGLVEDFIESGKEDDLKEYTNGLIRPWGKENELALIRNKKMVLGLLSDTLNQKAALFSDRAAKLASILLVTGRQKAAD